MDTAVMSALIQATGTVLAAITGSVVFYLLGQKWLKAQADKSRLIIALNDIEFLLQTEAYLLKHTQLTKVEVRKHISAQGFSFSGQNTPGRTKDLRQQLSRQTATVEPPL